MAYEKIKQRLDEDDQQKENLQKTSTEGTLAQGSAGGSSTAPSFAPASNPTAQNLGGNRQAFKINQGRQTSQPFFDKTSSQLGEARNQLQSNVDTFNTEAKNNEFKFDTAEVDKAIEGDQPSYDSTFSKVTGMFKPIRELNSNVSNNLFEGIKQGGTDEALRNMFREQAGAQYTAGEAAFDLSSLKSSKGFQENLDKQLAEYNAFQNEQKNLNETLGNKTNEELKSKFEKGQSDLNNYLQGRQSAIIAGNQAEADQENFKLNTKKKFNNIDQDLAPILAGLKNTITDKSQQGFLDSAAKNLKGEDYISYADPYTADEFYSEEEAKQYNKILELLGRGGQIKTASSPLKEKRKFNTEKARKDLFDLSSASENTQRSEAKTKLDAELRNLQRLVAETNKDYETNNYFVKSGDLDNLIKQDYSGQIGLNNKNIDKYKTVLGSVLEELNRDNFANQFTSRPQAEQWEDMIGDVNVGRLNDLADKADIARRFKSADRTGKGAWKFDTPKATEAFKKLLSEKVNKLGYNYDPDDPVDGTKIPNQNNGTGIFNKIINSFGRGGR